MVRRLFGSTIEVLSVLLLLVLVGGQLLGQPLLLGFVTSESMAPTLQSGDGFIALPPQVVGSIDPGDIVVFEAEHLDGGGFTTHRIVGETDRGFRTKGDANPFPDQAGDEPPVKRAQVVAVVWRPLGDVVVLPFVGTGVTTARSALESFQLATARLVGDEALLGPQGLAYVLAGLTAVLYVIDLLITRTSSRSVDRSPRRETGRPIRPILIGLTLLVVSAATLAMVVPAGSHQYGIVSSESDAPGPRVIERGTSETVRYPVANGGFLPIHVFLNSADPALSVSSHELTVGPQRTQTATVRIAAPPENGYFRYTLREHRYLAILPPAHLRALHSVHPWLPIAVIDGLLGIGLYGLLATIVGTHPLRRRGRDVDFSLLTRLRRVVNGLYR